MSNWIIRLYHTGLIARLLHTPLYCLKRELKGLSSVLDVGCGPDSPIQHCEVDYATGVEVFEPFLDASKKKGIHDKYILDDIARLDFEENSYDAVLLMEVLEHLKKDDGKRLLEKVESWARKKVIITTPNGYLEQGELSGNPYEAHRSGWSVKEMTSRGYAAYGLAGWKFLRKGDTEAGYGVSGNAIFTTIKFRPRTFWVLVSGLTQLVTYYVPRLAHEVFYVKNVG